MDGWMIQARKKSCRAVMVREKAGGEWGWWEMLVEVCRGETVRDALKRATDGGFRWCLAAEAAMEMGWDGEGFCKAEICGAEVRLVVADVMELTTVTVDESLSPLW